MIKKPYQLIGEKYRDKLRSATSSDILSDSKKKLNELIDQNLEYEQDSKIGKSPSSHPIHQKETNPLVYLGRKASFPSISKAHKVDNLLSRSKPS